MNSLLYEDIVRNALREDMGFEDITSAAIVDPDHFSSARLVAKEHGTVAGLEIAATAFKLLDAQVQFSPLIAEGTQVQPGDILATVTGQTLALLGAERTALNLLQRLSGIATCASQAVHKVKEYNCRIIDTRKTTPGLRALEKYAVRLGGAHNHRLGLFDAVLIKDNHIAAAGGIAKAVSLVKNKVSHMVKVEVEVETMDQVTEALQAGVDIVMLDNMSCELMTEAVKRIAGRCLTEASGGICLDNLTEVAATGVDLISLGWLTHSPKALDISMKITGTTAL